MNTLNGNYKEARLIRISRTAQAPSVLSTSKAQNRYNHNDVVVALREMQHGKCCYCELHIPDSGPGKQVEHFRPKSQFKDVRYDWSNLLLACGECNYAKLDKFPVAADGEPLLLNPADPTLDPEDHIEFVVRETQTAYELPLGLAISRGRSPRGRESIRVIKLWGGHHVKRRKETLDKLRLYYTSLLTEVKRTASGVGNAHEVDRLKNELREAKRDDKAYAGLARTFHREYRLERLGIL